MSHSWHLRGATAGALEGSGWSCSESGPPRGKPPLEACRHLNINTFLNWSWDPVEIWKSESSSSMAPILLVSGTWLDFPSSGTQEIRTTFKIRPLLSQPQFLWMTAFSQHNSEWVKIRDWKLHFRHLLHGLRKCMMGIKEERPNTIKVPEKQTLRRLPPHIGILEQAKDLSLSSCLVTGWQR